MFTIFRKKTREPGVGDWVEWAKADDPREVALYIDIHEREGIEPSQWVVRDTRRREVLEVDAASLTPEERMSVPNRIVEAGRREFEEIRGLEDLLGEG